MHRRNLLLASAVGMFAGLPAEANTLFTAFAFPATGAPTLRTMPDRLAEVKNVLDFGADPTFSADSTVAIQAAVDWTASANRGTIYFPVGSYKTSAPITYNAADLNIRFLGDPGSFIGSGSGGVNGWLFDRSLGSPSNTARVVFEGLRMTNSRANGGCIRIGSTISGAVRDCMLNGYICLTTEDAPGVSSRNIHIENNVFTLNSIANVSGSHYIIIGGGGAIMGCTLSGADTAVRAYGSGLFISGNRAERNNTAWLLGLDSAGNNVGLSAFALTTSSSEGCWTAYDLAGLCEDFVIFSVGHQGHDADNAGVIANIQPTQYSMRIRADCARNGLIQSVTFGNWHDIAAMAIENATSRSNLIIEEVSAVAGSGPGVDWILPTNAYTALIDNCNSPAVFTYAGLPTGSDRYEGDEFDISDSNTATWGATVSSGGGSNRVRVRYNGTNWTVMGV